AAVARRTVRLILEPGLTSGAVRLHEKRYLVVGTGVGRHLDLGIDRRTRSSNRRLRMAAPARVQVEARAEPVGNGLRLLEFVFARVEEQALSCRQSCDGRAGSRVAATDARVAGRKRRRILGSADRRTKRDRERDR